MTHRSVLRTAIEAEDADAVEAALGGFHALDMIEPDDCALLGDLLSLDWHVRHEGIAQILQFARCRQAVPALETRALRVPDYLAWDEGHALARKCVWALADIGSPEARAALERLADCNVEVVRGFARRRLDRWAQEVPRKG